MKIRSRTTVFSAILASTLGTTPAFAFDRVQPPEIGVGKRASLAGSLASTTFGPADLTRGGFSLATPFTAPKDRGELLAQIFPTYNPDNGVSVWGMGFGTTLTITRSRITGSLAYDFAKGDELVSPFGRLTRGADGNWYPVGLEKPVRVVPSGNDFIAYHPDGSRWTFGGSARVIATGGTYAWYLREVRDALGHVTTLSWTPNTSGNLFLSQVDYGGRQTRQYRIELDYESVSLTDSQGVTRPRFVDYRSGSGLTLDRRVKKVTVRARNAKTGSFDERYHYDLRYLQEPVGAAFYLTRIDTTYASGEAAPPVTYTYNLKGADFATTSLREVPQLTTLFSTLGVTTDVIQPARAAVTDVDQDGNADLEIGDNDRTLISQKGSGSADDPLRFEVSTQPQPTAPACTSADQVGCVLDACRSSGDPGTRLSPRLLSQLNPTDSTLQVVTFQYDFDADQTAISICSRDGVRTSKQWVDSAWQQSQFTRFVDLNNDHMPDLVRVGYGRYDILPNVTQVAGQEAAVAWGAPVSGALLSASGDAFMPVTAWVSDASGDGIADIVAQYGDSILVWHGLGNFQFSMNAEELRFFDTDGTPLANLNHYKIIPADLNKDGLQDYFLSNAEGDTLNSRFISYFTNVGGRFVRTPILALDTLPESASEPVIATLDGTGNMAVTVTDEGKAYSVTLDGPGTGLLAAADDGKGTVLDFQYVRGPASPGVRHRHALLDRMRVQGSGYDTIAYDFQYAQPTMHSVGRFLVGFDRVTRKEGDLPSAPTGTNVMSFLNGDNWGGLLLSGRQTDGRLPDVVKVEERAYADASFQGLPFKRLAQSASGWTSADGTKRAVDVTTYDTYEGAFCPSQQTLTTANHGTLVTRTTRANPADLANHLHCLEARIVRSGAHGDGALDFGDERTIARDSAGLVTQIAAVGPDGPMVEEQVAYDSDHDPLRISVPGKGTTAIEYDPATKLPAKVTTPDGVSRIASRDAVTDATLTVLIDRGGSRSTDFASYDGQERLASHWSDLDASSALAPDQRYEYSYASTNHPATLTAHTLVDAATGVYRHTTELYTAANEKMAAAQLHGSGWVFDGLVARSRARRLEEHVQIANQPAATSFASIDYATLLRSNGGSLPVATASTTSSTLAMDVATATRFHVDVTKATTTTLAVTGDGQLSRATLVNGTNATTALLDPTGKLQLGYVDEAQTTYGYAYDALGRLRVVTLPDGARHRVTYDAYGRQSAIVRDGVERIENKYLAVPGSTTDLLLTKVITPVSSSSASSTPARAIAWTYDAAGRKVVERHTDLTSAAETAFTFFYDGSTPAAPTASGAAGLLTGVSGDGYTKAFTYRADGKLTHREVALTGFRTIAMDITYREDGTSLDEKIVVMDPQGNVLQRSTHRQEVDTFGRPSTTSWNGAPLLTTAYDDLGRPSTALFSTGDSVSLAYDDLTRNLIGFDQTRAAGAWAGVASTRTKRDDRGFVGREVLGIGPLSVERTYSYSPQGFLTLAIDGVRQ